MKIMETDNKVLLALLPEIIFDNLGKDVSSLKFIGGGSFGKVFRAELSGGGVIAVKAFRIEGAQEREAQQLRILSRNTDVNMPEVLFTYSDDRVALMAMTFVEGKNTLNPGFLLKSKAQKKAYAESVVFGMLQWHSVKGDKFGSIDNPVYDTWLEFYKNEKQKPWLKALGELCDKGKFSRKEFELLLEATEQFNSLPEEKTEPVLIHGDLNIMNIMADPKTMRLTAFIDPCGSMWADREYDLFQLRNMWGDAYGIYETYKAECKMSEYTDFRVAYYASMHEAAMRLSGGLVVPLWEKLNNNRLKREMKLLKEKM